VEDFDATGFVNLAEAPKYADPENYKFPTPSGKIEVISEKLEKQGIPSLKPYTPPQRPPQGQFRLTFGRCALHTQGHTVNNPMLFEQMPENVLWINDKAAAALKIGDGERVSVERNGYAETIAAKLTPLIHPEAVFVVHGFGHRLPVESRALGKGLADNRFMQGGLDLWDPAGGGIAMQEHFVRVAKIK
jgi:thiosulfate reductase/polysulfide reductase chain A